MKCYIFDLDGVLTETSEQHYEAWKELANEIGICIDKKFNEKLKGISRMESLEKILEYGNLSDKFTYKQKMILSEKKNKNYIESIKNLRPSDAYDGAEKLLHNLKKYGYKIALASASRNAPFILKSLELEKYFDYIVDSSKIKNGKPAPDIFLAASDYFNIHPSECIGVEDSVAGVEAIKASGMYAIGIGDKKVLFQADIVYRNVSEIITDDLI